MPAVKAVNLFKPNSAVSGSGALDKVKRDLLAAQLLQKEASSTDPIYSHGHGMAKLGAALLGNFAEGRQDEKVEGWQKDLTSAYTEAAGVGSSSTAPSPGIQRTSEVPDDVNERAKLAYTGLVDRYTKAGIAPEQASILAAGAAGNISGESNFDPGAVGDNGNSLGLFQMNGPRREALMQFAAKQGKSPNDPTVQLDHHLWEVTEGPERGSFERIKQAAKDPASAAAAFEQHYERPGKPSTEKRVAAAQQFFQKFGQTAPQAQAAVYQPDPSAPMQAQNVPHDGSPPPARLAQALAGYGNPADMPAPGAQEAQFAIPGQGRPQALQGQPQAPAGPSQQQRAALARILQNPLAGPAEKQWALQQLNPPTERVDLGDSVGIMQNGQLIRTYPKQRAPQYEKMEDGSLFDKNSGRIIPPQGGAQPKFRPLTDPNERAAAGIPADDKRPYQVSRDGEVKAVGGGGTTIRNEPPPEKGTRYIRDAAGNIMGVEPIPGSEADREAQEAARKKEAQASQTQRENNIVVQDIDRSIAALDESILPATGLMGRGLSVFTSTSANKLANTLPTIEAAISRDTIQKMRQNSPTGGALGQVSDKDIELLKSTYGSINQNQDPAELKYNLRRLKNMILDTVHGEGKGPAREDLGKKAGAAAEAPDTPKVGEVRKGYRFKGGDPAKPESWEKAQ